ncbi:MAG: flagellar motor switch protein FliM, partial [Chthoniobacteraceae bacterium]|nr:flagellar motor switch protein FliM [Chthoniobacteraceae bacterium]
FVQHLSARLSTFLRMECVIKIRKLSSSTFAKFCEGISSPTHVTLFQVEPLRGVGILDMSLPLALAIVDRLLGGKGRVIESDSCLTEMEIALVEDAIQLILSEWSNQWHDNNWNFQPRCIGTDTSGRFLQTSAAEAVTLTIDLEVTLGECIEHMQMGVPFSMIEVIVKKMQQSRLKGNDTRVKRMEWRAPYEEISVPVTAEWLVKEMSIRKVVSLHPGDVLEMPMELIKNTRVRLSDTPEFIGTIGVENGYVAVELTRRITSE